VQARASAAARSSNCEGRACRRFPGFMLHSLQ